MKIFYAVQATGNGHISRAAELLPYLEKYGEVDVFLSGSNSQLKTHIHAKYTSDGLSLVYNKNGGLSYSKILKNLNPIRIYSEAKKLPVDQYDIVLNDFECITSLACKIKKIPSLQFGHQASFLSPNSPRPKHKDRTGEFVLKNYSKSTKYLGLHFWPYDKNIVSPVLRNSILNCTPEFHHFIAVYLPQYSCNDILKKLQEFKSTKFIVHAKEIKKKEVIGNITLMPVDYEMFAESLIYCKGLITGAGFETPAEALYLGKQLVVIPINGQYEQLCNAAALMEWDVPVLRKLDEITQNTINTLLLKSKNQEFQLLHNTEEIVKMAIETALEMHK